jgi:two-component system, OmpR family, KDP operon response regulator KdpE
MSKPSDATAVLEQPAARVPTPVILCIDDDPLVVEVVRDHLTRYDVKVLSACFGVQGIWLAVLEHPDVIITDLRMPQGDGATVIETLRRNAKTAAIPIVVLTGRTEPGIEDRVRRLGAESCLHKPLHVYDLLAELRRYIEVRPKLQDA